MSELVGRFEVSFLENACCRIIRLIRHKGLRTVFHGGMRDDLSLSKFLPSDSLRLPLDDSLEIWTEASIVSAGEKFIPWSTLCASNDDSWTRFRAITREMTPILFDKIWQFERWQYLFNVWIFKNIAPRVDSFF